MPGRGKRQRHRAGADAPPPRRRPPHLDGDRSGPSARHLPGQRLRGGPPGRAAGPSDRPADARAPGRPAAPARRAIVTSPIRPAGPRGPPLPLVREAAPAACQRPGARHQRKEPPDAPRAYQPCLPGDGPDPQACGAAAGAKAAPGAGSPAGADRPGRWRRCGSSASTTPCALTCSRCCWAGCRRDAEAGRLRGPHGAPAGCAVGGRRLGRAAAHARPHLGAAHPGRPAAGRAGVGPLGPRPLTGWPTITPPPWSACTVSRSRAGAAGCASGSCGAAAAGPPGTWPTVPCPRPCRRAGRGSARRGSWSRSS